MIIIKGDKIANTNKLNKVNKELLNFIKSISEVGHRESYNSLLKKFAKIEKMDNYEFVSIRSFFNPSKIHSICFAIVNESKKNSIIPYCEFNNETGDFLIVYDKYDVTRIESTYTKSKNKASTFDPIKMIIGLLQSDKYSTLWTSDSLNSIQSVIDILRENITE